MRFVRFRGTAIIKNAAYLVICEQFSFCCDEETGQASEPHETLEQQFFKVPLKVTGDRNYSGGSTKLA